MARAAAPTAGSGVGRIERARAATGSGVTELDRVGERLQRLHERPSSVLTAATEVKLGARRRPQGRRRPGRRPARGDRRSHAGRARERFFAVEADARGDDGDLAGRRRRCDSCRRGGGGGGGWGGRAGAAGCASRVREGRCRRPRRRRRRRARGEAERAKMACVGLVGRRGRGVARLEGRRQGRGERPGEEERVRLGRAGRAEDEAASGRAHTRTRARGAGSASEVV